MTEEVMLDMEEVAGETPAEITEEAASQPIMMDLPTAINTVIARTEATAVAVAVINAFLDIIQQRDSAFSPEELAKIQNAINVETAKTDALYREIEKALAAKTASTESEPEAVQ